MDYHYKLFCFPPFFLKGRRGGFARTASDSENLPLAPLWQRGDSISVEFPFHCSMRLWQLERIFLISLSINYLLADSFRELG